MLVAANVHHLHQQRALIRLYFQKQSVCMREKDGLALPRAKHYGEIALAGSLHAPGSASSSFSRMLLPQKPKHKTFYQPSNARAERLAACSATNLVGRQIASDESVMALEDEEAKHERADVQQHSKEQRRV